MISVIVSGVDDGLTTTILVLFDPRGVVWYNSKNIIITKERDLLLFFL
jgi:hypothetical protein